MGEVDKKRVLLIDDDTSLLVTLSDFLRHHGYDVLTADSGEAGLEVLDGMTPDLIILDMSMPGMGGIGFLKEISTEEGRPNYPVLVLTARANMAEFFANVEVDGFIAKPCEPGDLVAEVSRIIFLRSGNMAAKTPAHFGCRVLVGEDEPVLSRKLVDALNEAGFVASALGSGPEIIEQAVLNPPDAVVLKLIFKHMNGDTLAGILKGMPKTADVPVVLYEGSGGRLEASSYRVSSAAIKRFVPTDEIGEIVEAVISVVTL